MAFRCCGHESCVSVAYVVDRGPLIAREIKQLVFQDRTPQRASELIALQSVVLGRKKVARVQIPVANIFEGGPMELICSGLGNDVDDRSPSASIACVEIVRLDAEFGQRIRIRKCRVYIGDQILVCCTVQFVGHLIAVRAVY